MALAVQAVDARASDDAIGRLRAALEPRLLAEIGWDPATQTLKANVQHPVFGYAECEVGGCNQPAKRLGLCLACEDRVLRATGTRRPEPDALAEFKRIPRVPVRGEDRACRICCGDPEYTRPRQCWSSLCNAHLSLARTRGLSEEEFAAREDAVPLPTLGTCKRARCGRLAATRVGLCQACYQTWRTRRNRPDMASFCADVPMEVNQRPSASLVGLPEQLRLELLYVAQRLVDGRFKSARVRFEALASGCRTAPAQSLMAIDEWPFTRDGRRTLRFAKRELDKLYVDPEAEFTANVWNLQKLGISGPGRMTEVDFTAISQEWLREAAKRWMREKLLEQNAGGRASCPGRAEASLRLAAATGGRR